MRSALTREAEFVRALRRCGAVSPSTACTRSELPDIPPERLAELIRSGPLREATPGRYYLAELVSSSAFDTELPVVGFWRRGVGWVAPWVALLLAFLLFAWLRS